MFEVHDLQSRDVFDRVTVNVKVVSAKECTTVAEKNLQELMIGDSSGKVERCNCRCGRCRSTSWKRGKLLPERFHGEGLSRYKILNNAMRRGRGASN